MVGSTAFTCWRMHSKQHYARFVCIIWELQHYQGVRNQVTELIISGAVDRGGKSLQEKQTITPRCEKLQMSRLLLDLFMSDFSKLMIARHWR